MTIYDLKPAFQNLLRPLVRIFHKAHITPNQITVITCLFSCAYGVALYLNIENKFMLLSVPFFFLIRMGLNAIDGILAKEFKLTSKLGAILNEITDVISDVFLYMAFAIHPLLDTKLVIAMSFLAILTEMTGVSALHIGSQRRFEGPMGKSDRAFIISLLALLLAYSSLEESFFCYYYYLINFTLILTVINRVRKAVMVN